ncbi:MAG: hypothetical protein OEY61_03215 [Gammaproteobacteria bacterium]|nr:hypothetical protein [Gammaproteobacteria bacterium]
MTQLHVSKIHITLVVKVPDNLLARHLPSSAEVVGEALTEQVLALVKKNKLGYFPAVDFASQQGSIDEELLDAAETIGWFAARLVREEVYKKLRPFFSTISFQAVQNLAFSMPSVRPNQINAYQLLVEHYTPNQIKLDIIASVLKKQQYPDGLSNWAKQLFTRNLENSFEDFKVTQTVVM